MKVRILKWVGKTEPVQSLRDFHESLLMSFRVHAPADNPQLYKSCCSTRPGGRRPRIPRSPASSCTGTLYSPTLRPPPAPPLPRCPFSCTCRVYHKVIFHPGGDCLVPRIRLRWLSPLQKTVDAAHRRPSLPTMAARETYPLSIRTLVTYSDQAGDIPVLISSEA